MDEVTRSRVVEAEPPAAEWTGREAPALFDLFDVSVYRGRFVLHGLDPAQQAALRRHLRPYSHFIRNAVVRDRFDDVFQFAPESLRTADCASVEEDSTFVLSPWHPDNAYHLHCNNLVAMFVNVQQAGALHQTKRLYLYDGDAERNARAVQLWSVMAELFDEAVSPLAELLSRDGRTAFRHIRWGVGPHLFYLRDVRATSFGAAAIDYQRWVLNRFGITARETPVSDTARPTVLILSRTGHRRIVNEDLLAEALRARGLECRVFREWATTSARDLVALAHSADILVGVHGAALAHMAYQPPGSLVAELRIDDRHPAVFEHMAPHFTHRHVAIPVATSGVGDVREIDEATARAAADQILSAWADRRRRRVITVRTLGAGKWGNEVFWYMFGKTYARRHDLEFQTDAWAGNVLVGASDPPVARDLPHVHEKTVHGLHDTRIPNAPPLGDVNVTGYFQYHTSWYAPDRDAIRALFRPAPALESAIAPGWERLRQRGRTAVAIHIRRGDYGFAYFYRTPVSWYLDQLERIWPTLDRPFLYVASDDLPAVITQFARYNPVTADDVCAPLPAHEFYRDFYVLQHADVLLIPNSTFSFAASMLNERLQAAYRSHLPSRGFVPFDPWNAKPLDQDWAAHVERYPWISELWRPTPSWQRWTLWARGQARRAAKGVRWVSQRLYPGTVRRAAGAVAQIRYTASAWRRRP